MSETPTAADPNADQVTYWNAEAGLRWTELQDRIDTMFAELTDVALDRAAPLPGERVVDIGCGCGATVLALAERVGARGAVLGVDVSAPMLARASARIAGLPQAAVKEADAALHSFEPSANLVFSRFGVMFFVDPAAAFANIRSALVPGGRLVMVVWRSLAENEWMNLPLRAALPHAPPQEPADPYAPGPHALADVERLRRILTEAGFVDIAATPHDFAVQLASPGESAQAAVRATQIGPAARCLADAEPAARQAAIAAIRDVFVAREEASGLALGGAVWLVSAQAP